MDNKRPANLNDYQAIWEKPYRNHDAYLELPWEKERPTEVLDEFKGYVVPNKETRILDFGCGSGRLGKYIEEDTAFKGKMYYYDISENALQICVEKNGIPSERIIHPKINGDGNETAFDSLERQFDGIIIWGVFHHLPEEIRKSTWLLINRIMKPDGVLLLAEFDQDDVLFKKSINRVSEITGVDTFAINVEEVVHDDFVLLGEKRHFYFHESQGRLERKLSGEKEEIKKLRLGQNRTVSYVFAKPSLISRLKSAVVNKMMRNSEFSHILEYKFTNSLLDPNNNVGEYYVKNSDVSKKLWLHSMALFLAFDMVRDSGVTLWSSSFTTLLFKDSEKRFSFLFKSTNDDVGEKTKITIKKQSDSPCSNLYRIALYVPEKYYFSTRVFEEKYKEKNKKDFDWSFSLPSIYNRYNSFHKSAQHRITELKQVGLYIFDANDNHVREILKTLDDALTQALNDNHELIPLRDAILMVLFFVYPINSYSGDKTYITVAPPSFEAQLSGLDGNRMKEITAGGVMMYNSNKPFTSENEERDFLYDVIKWSNTLTTKKLIEFTRNESVKSAIAQVMARNMSHNMGSHVYNNLTGYDIYDKLVEKANANFYISDQTEDLDANHQLAYFNQYQKSRMDYLSEVTFGVPNLLMTRMVYGDLFMSFDRVRLLLNYISGISGFEYCFDFQYNGEKLNKVDDIGVAFPGDELGFQAFTNILENLVRNTAKHANNKDNKTVVFHVCFWDLVDNEKHSCKDLEDVMGVDDLYCVEIDNGIEEDGIDEIVNGEKNEKGQIIKKGQIDRLNDSVLDQENKLRDHSLGLLEMEASAAFLRCIDLPEIESDDYYVDKNDLYYHERNGKKRLNILKAFKTDRNTLGYRFFVQKPKEFLFVGDDWKVANNSGRKTKLRRIGVQFVTQKEFMAALGQGKPFAHQFLFYSHSLSEKAKQCLGDIECKTLLPLRKLEVDPEALINVWNEPNILQKLKEIAWDQYFKEVVNKELGTMANNELDVNPEMAGEFEGAYFNQVTLLDHANKDSHKNSWSHAIVYKEQGHCESWIENLTSRTRIKLPGFAEYSSGKDNASDKLVKYYCENIVKVASLKQEVFEAYHNKVVVLDERIQKFAEENTEGSSEIGSEQILCKDLFKSTNVLIPGIPEKDPNGQFVPSDDPNVFSLAPVSFKGSEEKVEQFVNDNINNAFLVVHFGVLERLYGNDMQKIETRLIEWARKAKRVVVTSGRGAHSLNLPKQVCFVNLSSVLNAFAENRNKYLINYLCHQSRRKNE